MPHPLSLYLAIGILGASLTLAPTSGDGTKQATQSSTLPTTITQPLATISPRMRGDAVKLPIVFEANRGQFISKVQYRARGPAFELLLEHNGIRFETRPPKPKTNSRTPVNDSILLRFANAANALEWRGQDPLPGSANYFHGNDKTRWRTNVPLYSGAGAMSMALGVDCLVYAGDRGLEMDFDLAPNTDLRRLRMEVTGAAKMRITPEGDLLIAGRTAEIRLRKPAIYQMSNGHRVPIRGGYALASRHEVAFRAEAYDQELPLVIDPSVAVNYTTFLGGIGADSANSIALDPAGDVYISGTTTAAPSFQETATQKGPPGGASDFFIAKIDPTKTGPASLVYLTFVGGAGDESFGKLALNNKTGTVALVGTTTSADYPVTDATKLTKGTSDLTISVLNPTGSAFIFSTVLDATGAASSIGTPAAAFDPTGNIIIAADTTAPDLPVTAGAFNPTYGGGTTDGLLAVFTPTGTLTYLTYFGINGFTDINNVPQTVTVGVSSVAVDLLGHAYVAGFTSQPGPGFPIKNGFQTTYAGGPYDAFLIALKPKGLAAADLIYSTFLGGSDSDQARAVAVDQAIPANAYVAGTTSSTDALTASPPPLTGPQSALHGPANAFLAAISQSQSGAAALTYATYLGGSSSDSSLSVAALSPQAVYLTGHATSFDFPTLDSLQSFSGTGDAFLTKLDTTAAGAASLLYATLLGGGSDSQGNGVAALPTGEIAVAGRTTSNDFPIAGNPQSGAQPICASCQSMPAEPDAFAVTFAESAATGPIVSFNAPQLNFGNQLVGATNPPQVGILINGGASALTITGIAITGANASDFSQSNNCPLSPATLAPQVSCQLTVNFSPSVPAAESAAITFTDDAVGSPQSINLTGTGQEPLVSISAAAVNFGNQPQGTVSNSQTLTLTNAGNLALKFSVVNMTGPDVAQFRFTGSNTCVNPPVVQPGATCIMNVAFAPQSMGPFNATIVLADNSGNAPAASQTISLSGIGTAAAPTATVAPPSINFGSTSIGATSGPQFIALSNTGSLPLQLTSIAFNGPNASDFKVAPASTCPIGGGTLAASAACTVNVVFTPASNGSKSATLNFFDNVSTSPQQVALSASGVSGTIALSATTISFQAQTLKMPTPASLVTLTNPGTTAVQVSAIAVTGPNNLDFLETNNCPATLSPTTSCQVNVVFQPQSGGARTATLTFADTAANSPQTVTLNGTGLVPAVTLSSPSVNFPPQLAGTISPPSSVTIMNAGNGGLVISSLAISVASTTGATNTIAAKARFAVSNIAASTASTTSTNAAEFSATQNCGAMLAPAASCAVSVVFQPQPGQAGPAAATISIIDNALDSPQSIALTGSAADFSLGATSSGSLSAVVNSGETAAYHLQVNSLDGFAGNIALSCTGAPDNAACAISPSPVSATATSAAPFTVSVLTKHAAATSPALPLTILQWPHRFPPATAAAFAILAALLGVVALRHRRRECPRWAAGYAFALALLAVTALSSCGGSLGSAPQSSSQVSTPSGTYTLTVTGAFTLPGATQPVSRSVQITLAVQ